MPSLAGKCVTGGRLNLRKALTPIRLTGIAAAGNGPFQLHLSATTNLTCVIQASTNLVNWSPLFTNTTSASGTFDFTDNQSTNWPSGSTARSLRRDRALQDAGINYQQSTIN